MHACTSELWHDKTDTMSVRQAKTRVILGIPQSDQSSLCVQWVTIDSLILHAYIEDSNHAELMPRVI